MTELLYFDLDGDTSIAVEIDDVDSGFEESAARERLQLAQQSFSTALDRGRKAAEQVLERFRDMAVRPDEICVEMGLKMSGEAGVVLARTATEAHVVLKLAWHPTAD